MVEPSAVRVSFVVPAKNEEAYLPATHESIRNLKTDVPEAAIVVDGGSVDNPPSIIRRWLHRRSLVVVHAVDRSSSFTPSIARRRSRPQSRRRA